MTAGIIIGQTSDNLRFYVLDAFKEQLDPDEVARTIQKFCGRWSRLAYSYDGLFQAGIEKTAWTDFLKPLLEAEQRNHETDAYFAVDPIDEDKQSLRDGIRVLQLPYRAGMYKWPFSIMQEKTRKDDGKYEVLPELFHEFVKYPGLFHNELLQAHAIAHKLTQLPHFRENLAIETELDRARRHDLAIEKRDAPRVIVEGGEDFVPSLGGYDSGDYEA